MASRPRSQRPTALHPRFLTVAVTLLHIVATLLVFYELDLQHYQTAKKQLVTENFDDYLTLPTENLKALAVEALYSPFPSSRARALSELHSIVGQLLQEPVTPVFRFVLRAPDGTILLDRADATKPARLESWQNRLFLSGFNGFVDMRLPSPLTVAERGAAVGRLQAYYCSPVDKQAISSLTRSFQMTSLVILGASLLFYAMVYRALLRPMESVSLQLEASRTQPPRLIPRPGSMLEYGFNHMALQALLQQLDQILEPLLRPTLPQDEVIPTVREAMDFVRDNFAAERVIVARLSTRESEPAIVEAFVSPEGLDLLPEERAALLAAHSDGSDNLSAEDENFVRARLPLPAQILVALVVLPANAADPHLARTALLAAAQALLRPLAAAAAMHQELFRQSREANIILSRNLGHDLTNIIATAKLDLAVLRKLLEVDPTTLPVRKIGMIQTSVTALLNTTRFLQEVVNIYRAFSFLKRPIREPVILQDLLTQFVDAFRPSVSARVSIALETADKPIHATIETRLLKLALFNLMQNALDAIKRLPTSTEYELAEIRIRLLHDDRPRDSPAFIIEIADNGPGLCDAEGVPLNPAAIPSIFGFGYSTKDREVNEGLGLAWVRTIIEEFHGGTISAENLQPRGACFRITLPLTHQETESRPAQDR